MAKRTQTMCLLGHFLSEQTVTPAFMLILAETWEHIGNYNMFWRFYHISICAQPWQGTFRCSFPKLLGTMLTGDMDISELLLCHCKYHFNTATSKPIPSLSY